MQNNPPWRYSVAFCR